MSAFLRRQLTDYVEYHRDPMNCALHVVGIVILFLGLFGLSAGLDEIANPRLRRQV